VRSFTLPDTVEPGNLRAEYADGMLNLHLPKSEKAKRRQIDVNLPNDFLHAERLAPWGPRLFSGDNVTLSDLCHEPSRQERKGSAWANAPIQ
jgi:hypothetical protein